MILQGQRGHESPATSLYWAESIELLMSMHPVSLRRGRPLTDQELIQSLAELEAMANAAGIFEVTEDKTPPRTILKRPT